MFRLEPEPANPNGDMFRLLDVLPRRTEDGRVQNEIVTPVNDAGCIIVPSGDQKDIWKRVLSIDSAGKVVISDNDADYMTDEVRMQRLGWKWIYGYGIMEGFSTRLKELGHKADYTDSKTLELLDRAVARWVTALKANGIDLSNCYEPIHDEPNSKILDDFIAIARVLRRHGLKVAVDLATWCSLDDARRLAPVVDMWEPWEPRITTRDTAAEELAIYKASGKPIRPYLCSISGNTAPYLDYHRFRGIRAFLLGADGFCTWAANSWRGNDYRGSENVLDGKKAGTPGAFYVHHGDFGPVATMRLEAFREGIEDLYWLSRAASSESATKFRSKKYLNELLDRKDARAVRSWRNALLRALAAVQSMP